MGHCTTGRWVRQPRRRSPEEASIRRVWSSTYPSWLTPQLVSWFALVRFASPTVDDRGWRLLFSAAAHGPRWLAVGASAAARGAPWLAVAASAAAAGPR